MEGRCQWTPGGDTNAVICEPAWGCSGKSVSLLLDVYGSYDVLVGQRRKLESDELQMRTFFEEGDLLVAEVQAFFSDGAMSLHTRSLKYGKVAKWVSPCNSIYSRSLQLRNGQLVVVSPALIRRLKSHFISLPCGVDLIFGLNGYIWVSKHVQDSDHGEEGFDAEAVYSNQNDVSVPLPWAISTMFIYIPSRISILQHVPPLPVSAA